MSEAPEFPDCPALSSERAWVQTFEERRTIALERIADALWGTDDTAGIVQLVNGIEMNGRQN